MQKQRYKSKEKEKKGEKGEESKQNQNQNLMANGRLTELDEDRCQSLFWVCREKIEQRNIDIKETACSDKAISLLFFGANARQLYTLPLDSG